MLKGFTTLYVVSLCKIDYNLLLENSLFSGASVRHLLICTKFRVMFIEIDRMTSYNLPLCLCFQNHTLPYINRGAA